ncbi:helix-turn-helix domain-containing protein [Trinickia terrae]|uniref:Helix-turn-helix domain-containing protein n=1 Tax=Trinickia terrae TaxID=2571161 RepID=A0A4U1I5P4_9BURK|nr:helix-turn-helix domain-containing protein [Trinickia terrae]TKC88671.1 helix-turn-helix domain-containing protein [Trinickia terrae]
MNARQPLPFSARAIAHESCVIRRFESDDVDEHARSMEGWNLHFDQLSPGPFHGSLQEIRVDGVQLLRERVNRALLKRGAAWRGALSFSIPLEVEGAGYCGGAAMPERMLLVSDADSLPELRTPDSHDIAVLALSKQSLDALASLDEHAGEPRAAAHSLRLVPLASARYDALKTFLLTSFDADSTALAYPEARKALHDAVMLELADITSAEDGVVRLDETARRRLVERVRELVMSRPDAPLTVLDICRTVGTSRRKLQYCFEEMLGTHPAYYLRVLRLNAVRRELARHASDTASVSDIAFRWGFCHLSRFATHYRQLFGELPSATLKRPPR